MYLSVGVVCCLETYICVHKYSSCLLSTATTTAVCNLCVCTHSSSIRLLCVVVVVLLLLHRRGEKENKR